MKLNITDASKATGKARSTLYAHIKKGILSIEKDAENNTVIDIAELQRVYGDLVTSSGNTTKDATLQDVVRLQDETLSDVAIEVLKERLKATERERDNALRRETETRNEVDRLLGIVEAQTRQLSDTKATKTNNYWWQFWRR